MGKILQHIVATCEGWEAIFFSYKDGELFREPIVCSAFAAERPHVENGPDEEKYFEGMVLVNDGTRIGGINETPDYVGFLDYLHTKQPREKIKDRMDYFKDPVQQLMKIRKLGHRPAKNIRGAKKAEKKRS